MILHKAGDTNNGNVRIASPARLNPNFIYIGELFKKTLDNKYLTKIIFRIDMNTKGMIHYKSSLRT